MGMFADNNAKFLFKELARQFGKRAKQEAKRSYKFNNRPLSSEDIQQIKRGLSSQNAGSLSPRNDLRKWQEILKVKATSTHNSKGEEKDTCELAADKSYGMESSAYRSGNITQCRKKKGIKKANDGLHQWFNRRGGDGQKGWVSCQSCEDDKEGTKPCGRKDASKGTKRRCRPTCGACKDYPKRKGKS